MEGDHIKIWHWLTPFSWLYGLGVGIRNILFDSGILRSQQFDLPVISVGNLSVGGTGKTPHTEYLIRLLGKEFQVAVLSRGYKRKSKGFRLATADTPAQEVGDEPFQMKRKFPHIHMAVDCDRCHGIRQLRSANVQPPVEVVILDDAYQHRYVTPGINILLMDYHRLVCFDRLLPAGRLREPQSGSQRADIVVVTKCPKSITPMERHGIARSLELQPWQKLFFTHFKYGNLRNLTTDQEIPLKELKRNKYNVVLLTGIASPQQMEDDLREFCHFTSLHFPDHHDFTPKDMNLVDKAIAKATTADKTTIVVTTEKDAARLHCQSDNFYYLPVEVEVLGNRGKDFNSIILEYVRTNSRDGILSPAKDDHQS